MTQYGGDFGQANALEVYGLTKNYTSFTLDNVSFTLPLGTAMGLIGENGAGKSTTLSLILDLIPRDGGEVRVLGCDNQSPDFAECREKVGVVFDEALFPDGLTAAQVGKIEKKLYKYWEEETYQAHLKEYRLPADKPIKEFSRGMKMKLSLAVALSHQAQILILDEATGGLDPIARDELLDELRDFSSDGQHSILLSSHIISDIEKLCDLVAFLHEGRLMLCESREEVLRKHPAPTLEEAILTIVREERRR